MGNALGAMAGSYWPYTVTFARVSETKSATGGNVRSTSNTTPANIPCIIRPASSKELQSTGKAQGSAVYAIVVPNHYSSALVDVDARCVGTTASVTGGEPSRVYNVIAPQRNMGLSIVVLATLAE